MGRGRRWSVGVALAAAYLLVVQIILTGLSAGLHAAPLRPDTLGHVICTPADATEAADGSLPPGRHADHQECCIVGRGVLGAGLVPAPAGAVRLGLRPLGTALPFPDRDAPPIERSAHSPHQSRAPPSAA